MARRLKVVRGWVWPGLILILLGVVLANFQVDAPWLVGSVGVYPLVVYGAGLVLAWRYRRSRVAAVLLGLFMMDVLLRPAPSTLQPGVGSVWDASGVVFLFLLPIVVAMKDRGVISSRGLVQMAVIPVGLAIGLMIWAVRPGALSWTWQTLFPWDLSGLGLSDAQVAMGLLALLFIGGLAGGRGHRLDKGFFWIGLALLLALRGGPDSVESSIYLSMAGLVLVVNVLEKVYALSLQDAVTLLPARRALWREMKQAEAPCALALVSVDDYKTLHDRYGRDASDGVMKKVAAELRMVGRHARPFRYSGEDFVLVFPGRGRNDVLGDLEELRADVEDFHYPMHTRAPGNGKGVAGAQPSAQWSLTITVGVAERQEGGGWWLRRYSTLHRAARAALERGRKAGGNTVSK